MATGPITVISHQPQTGCFCKKLLFSHNTSMNMCSPNNKVVTAGPNKVLTFAGGPVVYEHEWNQIPSARGEQPYMSAIAGIIHDSSHLALLFLG